MTIYSQKKAIDALSDNGYMLIKFHNSVLNYKYPLFILDEFHGLFP